MKICKNAGFFTPDKKAAGPAAGSEEAGPLRQLLSN